ncbi:MAG: glycosyltransferase family 4 protein [Acidimicrobiia bacterium]|jgi:glycosyltransferase involved in cell wall biosynthesis
MRILQVVTDNDRRGAQVFATQLQDALRARSHTVETVALVEGAVGGLGLEVLGRRFPSRATIRALRSHMTGFDITVAHGSSTLPACAIAGSRRRPFVYRQISDSAFWAPTWVKRTRTRVALNRACVVVALSEYNRGLLIRPIGVRPDRIVVVPNGVPAGEFVPADAAVRANARAPLGLPDAPTALFVGALVPEKGADLAIRAAAGVPDAHLVVAGAGAELDRLERLAADVAPGRVHFVGTTADAARLYHAADLVVLPSRGGDAMPAVLLEAGLCGLPVVSTRIGAIPEVVVTGTTGIVVAPDDQTALDHAVGRLLGDPTLRSTMGAAARTRCLERYEIGSVAEQWETVLERAVALA